MLRSGWNLQGESTRGRGHYGGEQQRPDGARRRSGLELPTLFVERTIPCSVKGQSTPCWPLSSLQLAQRSLAEWRLPARSGRHRESAADCSSARPESAVVRNTTITRMVDRAIFGTVTYERDRAPGAIPYRRGHHRIAP